MDAFELTLLVVDPDPSILQGLGIRLEHGGVDVIFAQTGKEGLSLYQSRDFPLVVCEMRLPDMSGARFAERLRELDPDQALMFYTSMPERDCVAAARAVDAVPVTKSMDLEAVVRLVIWTIGKAASTTSMRKDREQMVHRVQSRRAQERMIGRYAERWEEEEEEARATLVSFARAKRMSLNKLADIANRRKEEERVARAELERRLAEGVPEILKELDRYHFRRTGRIPRGWPGGCSMYPDVVIDPADSCGES